MHFTEIVFGLFLFFVFKYTFMTAYALIVVGGFKAAAEKKREQRKQKGAKG